MAALLLQKIRETKKFFQLPLLGRTDHLILIQKVCKEIYNKKNIYSRISFREEEQRGFL
jgi:hypothetical protein